MHASATAERSARSRRRPPEPGLFDRVWLVVDGHRLGPLDFELAVRRGSALHTAGVAWGRMSIRIVRRGAHAAARAVDVPVAGGLVHCDPHGRLTRAAAFRG